MKNYLLVLCFVLLLQGCNEQIQKQSLSKTELTNVLNGDSDFKNLITLNTNYLTQLNLSLSSLNSDQVNFIKEINLKYASSEDFNKFSTPSERIFFSALTETYNKSLADGYFEFINRLNQKYNYKQSDLIDLIINATRENVASKDLVSSRTQDCGGLCADYAMGVWYGAISGGNSYQYSATVANYAQAACLYGCLGGKYR